VKTSNVSELLLIESSTDRHSHLVIDAKITNNSSCLKRK